MSRSCQKGWNMLPKIKIPFGNKVNKKGKMERKEGSDKWWKQKGTCYVVVHVTLDYILLQQRSYNVFSSERIPVVLWVKVDSMCYSLNITRENCFLNMMISLQMRIWFLPTTCWTAICGTLKFLTKIWLLVKWTEQQWYYNFLHNSLGNNSSQRSLQL